MRNDSPVFIDWAAGAIAHPFCGLAKTLRLLVRHFGAKPGGRELRHRVRARCSLPRSRKERVLDSLSAFTREIYADGMAAQLIAFENAMHEPDTLGA